MALIDLQMNNAIGVLCFDRNKLIISSHNLLRVYDSGTLEYEEFMYPIQAPISRVTLSLDGYVVYVLFTTGELLSTNLETKVTDTVIPWSNDMLIVRNIAGEKGEIFVMNCRPAGSLSVNIDVERWNSDMGTIIETLPVQIIRLYDMIYFSREKRVMCINTDRRVVMWDTNTSQLVVSAGEVFEGHHSNIMAVNDTMAALICDDMHALNVSYHLVIYDIFNMKVVKKMVCPFYKIQTVKIIAVLEQRYIILYTAHSLWIYDVAGEGPICRWNHDRDLTVHVTVSPDGMLVADMGNTNGVRVSKCTFGLIPPLLTETLQIDDENAIVVSLYAKMGCVKFGDTDRFWIDTSTTVTNVSLGKITVNTLGKSMSIASKNVFVWTEAIKSIVSSKAAPKDEQALRTNANIVNWYKYDLFQMASLQEKHRGIFGLRIPVNAIQLIGQYITN